MRLLACLAVATGCSQVFGLEEPQPRDASMPSDGGSDAAPADSAGDAPMAARSLIEIIEGVQQSQNLLVALDAGDAASYDGSGQEWRNLVAGGVSFTRGSSTNASNDDPMFHGVTGARTAEEYFIFDGGDLFRETIGGWGDDEFHRDGAKVTILVVAWITPAAPGPMLFANCRCSDGNLATPGFVFFRSSATLRQAIFVEGQGQADLTTSTSVEVPTNAWSFMAVTADANGTTDVQHVLNTTYELYPDEPHPYGTGAADGAATIGAMSNGVNRAAPGTRIAMMAIWNRVLDKAALAALYAAIRAERFPSLPAVM